MATTTEAKPAKTAGQQQAADLLALLADSDGMPVADVLKVVPETALAAAWVRGDVQFGRPRHCVTGRPGVVVSGENPPTVVVETGVEWSGPKKAHSKRFADTYRDLTTLPNVPQHKKYVRLTHTPDGKIVPPGEECWGTVLVTRDEAAALLAPLVKLTDKGLSAYQDGVGA